MAELDATVLELGERPVVGLGRVAVGAVGEQRLGAEHFEHLLGVFLPVGGAVQVAAGGQARGDQLDEGALHQPALVVALLGPRVGEIDVHASQRTLGDHVAQHLDGVVLDDAQVGDAALVDQLAQAADARRVHLDAEEVFIGPGLGDHRRGLPHAEADLDDVWRLAAEHRVEVHRLGAVGHADLGHHLVQKAVLRVRHAALAQHEAADRLGGEAAAGGLLVGGGGLLFVSHGEIRKTITAHPWVRREKWKESARLLGGLASCRCGFSRTRRSNRGSTLISARSAAEAAPTAYAGPCRAQLPISPLVGELGLAV